MTFEGKLFQLSSKVYPFTKAQSSYEEFEENQKLINARRDEDWMKLVLNTNVKESSKYLLRPIGGACLGIIVVVIGLVVWPQHDVVVEPKYWWECLVLQCDVIWVNMSASFFIFSANALMNMDGVFKFKHYLATWFWGCFFYSISWCVTYAIWVYVFGLRYPIPMTGIVNAVLGLSSQVLAVWLQFPRDWSKYTEFRKRRRYLVLTYLVCITLSICYLALWFGFVKMPVDYQWIMALFLPVFREIVGHLLSFLG